jgi:predicted nucleotide-binding protein (sugar kinase/HSP70/actin superfamily)
MRVGLPRALLTYDELPLWQTFLSELGAEVIVSPETNRAVLGDGLRRSVDESCLPVKAFVGHLLALGTTVDYLFVPRLVNRGRQSYYCPKLAGLPDIARSFSDETAPVLEVTIDLHRNPRALPASLERVARQLGRPGCGRKAYQKGLAVQRGETANPPPDEGPAERLTIGLLGRSYSLLDPLVGYDVLTRLERLGVRVISGGVSGEGEIPPKLYWEQDRRLFRRASGWLAGKRVHGIVHVISFECGPDALFAELLGQVCREADLPALPLVLDEHVEEAGLVTRLEAFVDLLSTRVQRGWCIR